MYKRLLNGESEYNRRLTVDTLIYLYVKAWTGRRFRPGGGAASRARRCQTASCGIFMSCAGLQIAPASNRPGFKSPRLQIAPASNRPRGGGRFAAPEQPATEAHHRALVMRIGEMREEDCQAAEEHQIGDGIVEKGQALPLKELLQEGPRPLADHLHHREVDDIDAEGDAPDIARRL